MAQGAEVNSLQHARKLPLLPGHAFVPHVVAVSLLLQCCEEFVIERFPQCVLHITSSRTRDACQPSRACTLGWTAESLELDFAAFACFCLSLGGITGVTGGFSKLLAVASQKWQMLLESKWQEEKKKKNFTIVLAEFGRYPLCFHWWQQILRYHNRINNLSADERLIQCAFGGYA